MKPVFHPTSLNQPTSSPGLTEKERMARQVKCPTCQKLFVYGESAFRPFCSERCKMIDLGRWFKEEYRVAAEEQEGDSEVSDRSDAGEE